MREIRFRAWYKSDALMIDNESFGGSIPFSNTNYILMQYTGLKDKNGKEIYEGDILQDEDGIKHTIKWAGGDGDGCGCCDCFVGFLFLGFMSGAKIIGNIYEK